VAYPQVKVHSYGKKTPQHPQSKKKSGHGHVSSPQKAKVKSESPVKKRPLKPKPQEESQTEVGKRGAVNRIVKCNNGKFGHGDEQALRKETLPGRGKDLAKNLVLTGQLKILKREQALMPNNNDSSQLEIVNKKMACLAVSSTETLGTDPTLITRNRTWTSRYVSPKESRAAALPSVPKQRRHKFEIAERGNGVKTLNFPVLISEKWAGPAYSNSPAPSCLPLPSFSAKKSGEESVEIDRFATRDLRRLLGLD